MTNLPEISSSKIHFKSVLYNYWKASVNQKIASRHAIYLLRGVVGVLLSVQVELVSLDLCLPGVEPFIKFDGQQLCSPLTYRPYTSSIERSKPIIKCVKISRGLQHF